MYVDDAERRAWEIVNRHTEVRAAVARNERIHEHDPRLHSDVWLAHEITRALRQQTSK